MDKKIKDNQTVNPDELIFHIRLMETFFFFKMQLIGLSFEKSGKMFVPVFSYTLKNITDRKFRIPIPLNEELILEDAKKRKKASVLPEYVMNLKTNAPMYGYGDDHNVSFDKGEEIGFAIHYKPVKKLHSFASIEYSKYGVDVPGRYLLRYKCTSGEPVESHLIKIFDVKKEIKEEIISLVVDETDLDMERRGIDGDWTRLEFEFEFIENNMIRFKSSYYINDQLAVVIDPDSFNIDPIIDIMLYLKKVTRTSNEPDWKKLKLISLGSDQYKITCE